MNERDWKPGAVALVLAEHSERVALKDTHGWAITNQRGDGTYSRWVCDDKVMPLRRLVVIDPEDREQVSRFVLSVEPDWGFCGYEADDEAPREPLPDVVDEFQRALREFANPTPPKPDEPTGLGAVVEDTDGDLWIRTCQPCDDCLNKPWQRGPVRKNWLIVAAVRVLSEGVTTDA